jgi:hypothetical protein
MAYVFDYTALLSGESWWGYQAPAKQVFITFSFETSPQPYLADYGYSAEYAGSFQAFTSAEQTLARQALGQWDGASGVRFLEAPTGQADMRFAKYNFALDSDPGMNAFGAFAFYPSAEIGPDVGWEDAIAGDVFVNANYPMTLGLLLHEIGHALGLKHPFDPDPMLHPNFDNSFHTVMSYTGPDPFTLGALDRQAVASLYGAAGSDGAHVAHWSWDAANFVLTQVGGPQADTIRGVSTADVVFGEAGNDILFGSFGNDHLEGGSGDDALFGAPGSDFLRGGPGDDLIHGLTGFAEDPDDGIDAVDYSAALQPVTVDLAGIGNSGFQAQGADIGNDRLVAVENVIGGAGSDLLTGDGAGNALTGGPGDDIVDGRAGADQGVFSGPRAQYDLRTVRHGDTLETFVVHQGPGNDGSDTLRNVETLVFSGYHTGLAGAQLNRLSNIDGDRFDDVLIQNGATGQVVFAQMLDGVFASFGAATDALGADWKAVAAGNVNPALAGGAETFVQQQSTGAIYYASLDTGAVSWGVVSAALTPDWKLRVVADVNGDTCVDAVVQDQASGTILYADMRDGVFQDWRVVSNSLTADWIAVGAGDFDGDGFADVAVQQHSTGAILYAAMAGGVFSGWGVLAGALTPDWIARAVADVTGDGRADVVLQNSLGIGTPAGTTLFADVAAGAVQYGVVTASVDSNWVAEGVADVDNDGFADVVFQNKTSGTALYADMGPSGFQTWGIAAANLNADWHVV